MRTPRRALFVLILFAASSSVEARATETTATPDAVSAILHNFQLEIAPRGPHASVTLSVSGPGNYYSRQSFVAGEPVMFSVDQEGAPVSDGLYAWEAVLTPIVGDDLRRSMAAARAEGGDTAVRELRATGRLPSEAGTGSGFFRVVGGVIVTDQSPEPRPSEPSRRERRGDVRSSAEGGDRMRVGAADEFVDDDLLVKWSGCFGFYCEDGEVFGGATIKLKDDNVRILFEDASTSGSFPTNDRMLRANDSLNGGVERFTIEDVTGGKVPFTVRAGAPTHSFFIDPKGQVGFGTPTPKASLHTVEGNSPALRLEQNGSGGFTPQTFDVVGNETGFFVRDTTNGSTVPFKTDPDGPRHIGPMAEDFHALFPQGGDPKTLSVIDLSGATVAGIQALSSQVDALRTENEALRRDLASLVDLVESRMATVEQ